MSKLHVLICLFSSVICFGNSLVNIKDADVPELQYLDPTVDPCDDFYEFACGNFEKIHPLGEEEVVDQFTVLTEKIINFMIETLKNVNSTYDSKALNDVKTAFDSCIDLKVIDSRKPFPEVVFLNEIGGMPLFKTPKTQPPFNWREIGELTAKYGVPLLFRITVIPFPINPTANLIRVEEDTFSNPCMAHPNKEQHLLEILNTDLQNYFSESDSSDAPFGVFLKKFFKTLRDHINVDVKDEEIDIGIQEIRQFMKDLQGSSGRLANGTMDPLTTTTVMGDLQNWTDEQFDYDQPIDWMDYFNAVFGEAGVEMTNTTDVYVNSTYVYNVLNVVKNTRPDVVKNFVLMRVLLFSAMDSNKVIREAMEEYYIAKNLTVHSREEYCVRQLIDIEESDMKVGLSVASGRLFVENDDGDERLKKAKVMVKDLERTFLLFLRDSEWMDATSKSAAFEKAQKILALLGLPEFYKNNTALDRFYKGLNIEKLDSYGNNQRIRAFKQSYMFSQVGKPRNRELWDRSPFETDAYYNRANNKITIPFALMNPVLLGGKTSLMDYSHFGSVIGHEIIHAFDNNGRHYDGDGVVSDEWTNDTSNAYNEKTKCFEDQYSKYVVQELNRTIDGTVSLNENLADNSGLRIAYAASKKFFANFELESGNYTPEQLFFIGFGTTYCSTGTLGHLKYVLDKGYSTPKYRVIGALSNMEEFSKAFNCSKGSIMNPQKKCSLW